MTGTELAGRPFPDRLLPDLDGTPRSILGAAGSCVVVIGHSECGTTRLLVPFLKRMHDRRGAGSSVVLVLQDDPDAARSFLSDLHAADLPVRLEPAPWPLSSELDLETVPTLFRVTAAGVIEETSQGFQRAGIEGMARQIGVTPPFFLPEDKAPALRPG